MLDSAIALTVILFVLSIVSEKFIQLIRSYSYSFSLILIFISIFLIGRGFLNLFLKFEETKNHIFDNFPLLNNQPVTIICNSIFLISLFLFLSPHGQKLAKITKKETLKNYNSLVFLILFLIFFGLSIGLTKNAWHLSLGGFFLFSSLISLEILNFDNLIIGSRTISLKFFKRINNDFVSKGDGQEKEKKENEITLLSVFIGIIIALAFRVNFIDLISEIGINPQKVDIGWKKEEFPFQWNNKQKLFNIETWPFDPKFFIGILLTGFFLSFGSKFFHDLLDRLYYAKKAKQALSDPDILNQSSAAGVLEFVESYNLERTYHKYKSLLLNEQGIVGVSIRKKESSNRWIDFLMISLEGNHDGSFEEKVRGLIQDFEIPIQFESNVGAVRLTNGISFKDSIANSATPNIQGSFAIQVFKEGDPTINYVLTCFHVVKHKNHQWNGKLSSVSEENRVIVGTGNSPNGTIKDALKSDVWECALIEIDQGIQITPLQNQIGITVHNQRTLDQKKDLYKDSFMFSRVSRTNRKGEILSLDSSFEIDFNDGFGKVHMYDTIQVWNKERRKPIQEFGDSGNLLYDENGYALGIVFAKSDQYTYAMNINFPLNHFKVKIR